MSRYLVDEIDRRPQIAVSRYTEIAGLKGEHGLEALVLEDARTREQTEIPAKALFVFIGASPHTDWLRGFVAMDEDGFVLTGRDVQDGSLDRFGSDPPFFPDASRPGLFAVGDVHSGSIKRVASAVGEGSMTIRLVHQRLAEPR